MSDVEVLSAEETLARAIWAKMQEDTAQMANCPEGPRRDAMIEILGKLPGVVATTLDQPVGVESLMRTKRLYLGFVLEGQYVSRMVGDEMGGLFGAMAEMAEGMLQESLGMMDEVLKDVPGFLADQGVTEEIMLGHPRGGKLSAESMECWRAGNFTIRDLMLAQPWAVIDNT